MFIKYNDKDIHIKKEREKKAYLIHKKKRTKKKESRIKQN